MAKFLEERSQTIIHSMHRDTPLEKSKTMFKMVHERRVFVCMYHGMDVWMYGCMGVWMCGCVDAWMHGSSMDGCMDLWVYGCMGVWIMNVGEQTRKSSLVAGTTRARGKRCDSGT